MRLATLPVEALQKEKIAGCDSDSPGNSNSVLAIVGTYKKAAGNGKIQQLAGAAILATYFRF